MLGSDAVGSTSLQEVVPGSTDGSCDLGSSTNAFGAVHATGGVVHTVNAAITAATYTISDGEIITRYDTTSNGITVTLPDAATNNGRIYYLCFETEDGGGSNDVTINPDTGDTLFGGSPGQLVMASAGTGAGLLAVGTNWYTA